MNRTGVLAAVIVVLALALAAQSYYLITLQNSTKTLKKDLPGHPGTPAVSPSGKDQTNASAKNNTFAEDPWTSIPGTDWDPFKEMSRIQKEMDRMFRDSFGRSSMSPSLFDSGRLAWSFDPQIDLKDNGDHYSLTMDVPGTDKDKIKVTAKNNILTISGERAQNQEDKQGSRYFRRERSYGAFSRSITLPEDADSSNMCLEYKNGVLTASIPKLPVDRAKRPENISIT